MLKDFDECVKELKALKSWWSLGSTIAKYDKGFHVLRVDISQPTMVAMCGQEYAGAKNYHDAPDWFRDAILRELKERMPEIVQAAYNKELERLKTRINENRSLVLGALKVAEDF